MKPLISRILYIFSYAFVLIINFFYLFFKFKIGFIYTNRFGEQCFDTFILLNEKISNEEHTFFVFIDRNISSNYLFDKIKNSFFIIKKNSLNSFLLHTLMNNSNKFDYISDTLRYPEKFYYYSKISKLNNLKSLFKINNNKLKLFFKKNNIDFKSYIIFHNRDQKYLNLLNDNVNYDYHKYRNLNFSKFISPLNYLLKKNKIIFRIGLNEHENIDLNHKNFHKLNKINNNSQIDIELMSNCDLYFGSDSGAFTLAYLSNKPIFFINYSFNNIHVISFFKNTYVLLNNIIDKNNKIINALEIFNIKNLKQLYEVNNNKKYSIKKNSENEISEFLKEINLLKYKPGYINDDHKQLNERFWKIFRNRKDVIFGNFNTIISYNSLKKIFFIKK